MNKYIWRAELHIAAFYWHQYPAGIAKAQFYAWRSGCPLGSFWWNSLQPTSIYRRLLDV